MHTVSRSSHVEEWDDSSRGAPRSEGAAEPLFFVLRVDGTVNFAHVGLRRLCGVPTRQTMPDNVARYIHPRDLIVLRQQRATDNPATIDERIRIRDAAGAYRMCHVQAALIGTPELTDHWVGVCIVQDDAPARQPAGVSRDITIRNLMSGNDCVELLGMDERL